jgi:hypothetical protein
MTASMSKSTYNRNSYLESLSICYFELVYELIVILKVICGLDTRTNFFYETYGEFIQPYFENIIELGIVSYLLRVVKDLNLTTFM